MHAGGRFLLSKSLKARSSRFSGPQLRPPLPARISCLTGFRSVDQTSAKCASRYTFCVNSIRLVPGRILRTLKQRYKSRVSAEWPKWSPRLRENVFVDLLSGPTFLLLSSLPPQPSKNFQKHTPHEPLFCLARLLLACLHERLFATVDGVCMKACRGGVQTS